VATGYEDLEEGRIKHLEMIQAVVGRLASNAFLMKVGHWPSLSRFWDSLSTRRNEISAVALAPTVIFWGLDAYFLRCERLFRRLYSKVRAKDNGIEPFFMAATGKRFVRDFASASDADDVASWWATFWGKTLIPFYLTIVVSSAAVTLLLLCVAD
jgi:hypothetical protein